MHYLQLPQYTIGYQILVEIIQYQHRLVRTSLTSANPFASTVGPVLGFLQGFCNSLRLAIEVSGEIDHANHLAVLGYALVGVKEFYFSKPTVHCLHQMTGC